MSKGKKTKTTNAAGKRKAAMAQAIIRSGTGRIRINGILLDNFMPKICRLRIREPLMLAGDEMTGKINIDVRMRGGGVISQTDAARLAIGRALNAHAGKDKLKEVFLAYDRTLIVADTRRKESSKPNCQGSARSKRQKSYR